ncbi:MAG TPA: hypothetical protein PLP33_14490 [Leptospiraceae bacterium]|nr:hypothetical protein [Leptospiraceae bacterium]
METNSRYWQEKYEQSQAENEQLKDKLLEIEIHKSDDEGMYFLRVKEKKQLQESLKWALIQIEESNGVDKYSTPKHECGYDSAPDKGHCDFHDKYWIAKHLLMF